MIALVFGDDKEDLDSDGLLRVNPLQLLNVIRAQLATSKSLMFVQALVNEVRVKAIVDSGVTHNVMATRESEMLGLKHEEDANKITVVNNKAYKIHEIAKKVSLQVNSWKGNCSLLYVPLDDFDLILGINFFVKSNLALLPHLGGPMFLEESMWRKACHGLCRLYQRVPVGKVSNQRCCQQSN